MNASRSCAARCCVPFLSNCSLCFFVMRVFISISSSPVRRGLAPPVLGRRRVLCVAYGRYGACQLRERLDRVRGLFCRCVGGLTDVCEGI